MRRLAQGIEPATLRLPADPLHLLSPCHPDLGGDPTTAQTCAAVVWSYSASIVRAVLMILRVASTYPSSPMCIMVAQQAAMMPPGLEPAMEGEA